MSINLHKNQSLAGVVVGLSKDVWNQWIYAFYRCRVTPTYGFTLFKIFILFFSKGQNFSHIVGESGLWEKILSRNITFLIIAI